MRRDVLAAGAKSAKFAGGIGDTDIDRNIMSDEDRAALEAQTAEVVVQKAEAPRLVFRPRGTTILVRRIEVEALSPILITETMEKEKPAEGTILEVGPSVQGLGRNDRVVFGKYAGTEFKVNGEVLLIMDQDDVKGTLEPESQPPYEDEEGKTWLYNPNTKQWDIPAPVTDNWTGVGGCIVGRS